MPSISSQYTVDIAERFCGHALDTLEGVVQRYVELGFDWICLTEHMPAEVQRLMAPEDAAAGLSVGRVAGTIRSATLKKRAA